MTLTEMHSLSLTQQSQRCLTSLLHSQSYRCNNGIQQITSGARSRVPTDQSTMSVLQQCSCSVPAKQSTAISSNYRIMHSPTHAITGFIRRFIHMWDVLIRKSWRVHNRGERCNSSVTLTVFRKSILKRLLLPQAFGPRRGKLKCLYNHCIVGMQRFLVRKSLNP